MKRMHVVSMGLNHFGFESAVKASQAYQLLAGAVPLKHVYRGKLDFAEVDPANESGHLEVTMGMKTVELLRKGVITNRRRLLPENSDNKAEA